MVIFIVCDVITYIYFKDYIISMQNKNKNIITLYLPCNQIKDWFNIQKKSDEYRKNKYVFLQQDYGINNKGTETNIFILNMEQLTRKYYLDLFSKYLSRYQIIDYSEENILFLKNSGLIKINCDPIFLPYQFNPDEILNINKTQEVCFIGSLSLYRQTILDKIESLIEKKVNIVKGWEIERDRVLFSHKIIVNIHFNKEYNINEQLRINRCIFNKMIVVSERSLYDQNIFLKDYIIFCDYSEIPKMVEHILKYYEFFYEKIYKDFDLHRIDKSLSSYMQHNIFNP